MYKLKNGIESFSVVDGPFAGRTFVPGRMYGEIPPQEAHRFEKIKDHADLVAEFKPARADKTKGVDVNLSSQKATIEVAEENKEVQ